MENIVGMQEAFKESKLVYLTTINKEGEKNSRPMTNYNESPYEPMWFPSFKETKKINDIRNNPKVVISFPAEKPNTWYKVEGEASEAPWEEVKENWKWWLLEWVPESERKPLQYDDPFTDRSIIWVKPVKGVLDTSQE
jgi:general stress protein 26